MKKEEKFWLVISNFADRGIEPIIGSDTIPLDPKELMIISNYYAAILGYITDKSLVGPLPVAYHPEMLVLIYRFDIINENIKDKRVVSSGGKTQAYFMIFFKVGLDTILTNLRKQLIEKLMIWSEKTRNIKEISENDIKEFTMFVEKLLSLDIAKPITISDIEKERRKLFVRQIDFLSKLVKKEHSIFVFSDNKEFQLRNLEMMLSSGWSFIDSYKKGTLDKEFEIQVGKVKIMGKETKEMKLNIKDKTIFYFANVCGSETEDQTKETFKQIISSLTDKDQCLLCMYSTIGKIDFEKSPLFSIASSAIGKNLSIVEIKPEGENMVDAMNNFMYQLIEKHQ